MTFLKKHISLIFVFCFASSTLFALNHKEFKLHEDSLRVAIQRVASTRDTAQRMQLNRIFSELLVQTLRQDSAITYPFDSIPYLYKVTSQDGLVRVITWNVPLPEGLKYYGFVLFRKTKNDAASTVVMLRDNRKDTRIAEDKVLSANEWFGALYTSLVERYMPYTNAPVYTLVGISPTGGKSNKKVVDVLNIKNGECTFGAPVFVRKNRVTHRMIFEYNAQAVMELRYQESTGMIIFSNLVPMYRQLRGRYEHYIPSESYDAVKFENGQWMLRESVKPPSNIEIKKRTVTREEKKRGLK